MNFKFMMQKSLIFFLSLCNLLYLTKQLFVWHPNFVLVGALKKKKKKKKTQMEIKLEGYTKISFLFLFWPYHDIMGNTVAFI